MANAADIGANASNYTGNAALGGGTLGFGRLDTRPVEDLARYTFIYNKAEYDQRQKDAELAAQQIAESTSYDLTSSIPKDARYLERRYDELLNFIRDNPDAINYRNKEMWRKYREMRNDLENDIKGAGVRSTMYNLRNKEIADATLPEVKANYRDMLEKEVDDTDVRTPLLHSAKYDVEPVQVKPVKSMTVQTTDFGANFFGQAEWNIPDMDQINNQASVLETGLTTLADFENQPAYQQMSEEAKADARKAFLAQKASGKLEPVLSAKYFNDALKSLPDEYYIKADDGTRRLNIDKLKQSNNKILSGIAQQAEIFNQQMDRMRGYIKAGYFKDKFGGNLHFGNDASGLKEQNFKDINLDDGLTPGELLKMQIYGLSPTPQREIKVSPTDNSFQQQQINELVRHNKAMEGLDWDKYNLEAQKFKVESGGTEASISAALAFAKKLFADIASNGSVHGKLPDGTDGVVLTPDDLRKLTQEQLKYLGIETPSERDDQGNIIKSGGLSALELATNEAGNYTDVVQLNSDGTLLVMKNARFDPKTNRWIGQWDPKRSTSVWNAARNLLNEENQKSGSKERNAYVAIDLTGSAGDVSIDVSGGKTKASESTTTKDHLSADPKDWKQEGKYWRYKDGTLYDAEGKVVKEQ